MWTGRGLTAFDAAYVALAEQEAIRLVTDDEDMLAVAAAVAIPLAGATAILQFEPDEGRLEATEPQAGDAEPS